MVGTNSRPCGNDGGNGKNAADKNLLGKPALHGDIQKMHQSQVGSDGKAQQQHVPLNPERDQMEAKQKNDRQQNCSSADEEALMTGMKDVAFAELAQLSERMLAVGFRTLAVKNSIQGIKDPHASGHGDRSNPREHYAGSASEENAP